MTNYPTKYRLVLLIFQPIFFGLGIRHSRACHPTDREALLDFKRRITSDPPKLLGSWIPNKDCCTSWNGIKCNPSTSRVINFDHRGLYTIDKPINTTMSGTLSSFLGNLSSIQSLILSDLKNLTGPIPSELGKLTNLREMYIESNSLEGSIPSTIESMSQLEALVLSDNHLTGPIPHNLFKKLTSLKYLDFSNNNLSGSAPDRKPIQSHVIGSHKQSPQRKHPTVHRKNGILTSIELSDNELSGPIPSSIGNL